MKTVFFEKQHINVDPMSDLGARFQAVASELFSLACYGNFILKQAFPQTARGEYLDLHAQMRGAVRKNAAKATGYLTFSIPEALAYDIDIDEGVICSVEDKPYLQFVTVGNAVIAAGETSVQAEAIACADGAEYNVPAGSITVMVTSPLGVTAVTNANAFEGGWDEESDEALRRRLLAAYSVPPTGVSLKSLSEAMLALPNVADCCIYKNNNTLAVYVKTLSGMFDHGEREAITDALTIGSLFSMSITVNMASAAPYDLTVSLQTDAADTAQTAQAVRRVITDHARALRIGEVLDLSRLAQEAATVEGVKRCDITSDSAAGGIIPVGTGAYLALGDLTVNCYAV